MQVKGVRLKRGLNRAAHVFCRLHLWTAAIFTLARSAPFCELSESSLGRFLYACTMARRSRVARNEFARILRRQCDQSSTCNIWLGLAAWRFGRLQMASILLRRAAEFGGGGEDASLAKYLQTMAESHLNGQLRKDLQQVLIPILSRLDPSKPVIPVPVSSSYLDLFRLWASQVDRHLPASILAIALDEHAAVTLRNEYDHDIASLDLSRYFLVESSGRLHRYSRSHLWVLRTFLVRELVALDRQVMVLDLDAMPVSDISLMLAGLPEADIVAQIEPHSIPVDAARKMGFILCCGVMFFYPTQATRLFLDRYASRVVVELDDQVALNHILVEAGRPDMMRGSQWTRFESAGIRWSCPSAELVSRNEFEGRVIRHFQQTGQTIDELKARLGAEENVSFPDRVVTQES